MEAEPEVKAGGPTNGLSVPACDFQLRASLDLSEFRAENGLHCTLRIYPHQSIACDFGVACDFYIGCCTQFFAESRLCRNEINHNKSHVHLFIYII